MLNLLLLMDGCLIDRDFVDGSTCTGQNYGGICRRSVQLAANASRRRLRYQVAELLSVQIAIAVVVAMMRWIGYGSLTTVTLLPVFRHPYGFHLCSNQEKL